MPDHIQPDIWDEPEMHRALAVRAIGTVYRLLRAAGVSQRQIAELTGQSQSEVSEIMKGRRVIAYDVLKRIADGLGIPHGHLGLAQCDGQVSTYSDDDDGIDAAMDDDMISRRVLGSTSLALLGEAVLDGPVMQLGTTVLGEPGGLRLLSGPPGTLGKRDVAWIRTATERFRDFEREYGGATLYGAARGMAKQVVGALRSSSPNRELYVSVSGLCLITAWTAFESGRRRDFWQCHATALDLAHKAGDIDTVVTIVHHGGRAEINSGRHQAAAKLFELTSIRRPFDAVTWGLLGSAYAPNSAEQARNALRHLHDAPGADTPDAISMSGHLNFDLGDYPAAVEAYQKVLPMRSGVRAIQDTVPLSIAHLKAGETRVGVQHAETALTLAESVRSMPVAKTLTGMGTILAAQQDSTAQDLARRIATISTV